MPHLLVSFSIFLTLPKLLNCSFANPMISVISLHDPTCYSCISTSAPHNSAYKLYLQNTSIMSQMEINLKLNLRRFKQIPLNIQQSANQPIHSKLVTILQIFFKILNINEIHLGEPMSYQQTKGMQCISRITFFIFVHNPYMQC